MCGNKEDHRLFYSQESPRAWSKTNWSVSVGRFFLSLFQKYLVSFVKFVFCWNRNEVVALLLHHPLVHCTKKKKKKKKKKNQTGY